MLGKVVVIAGVGAAAWLLRTRTAQEVYARLAPQAALPGGRRQESVPALVDRRPQALEEGSRSAPALLPDATAAEVALAVTTEQSQQSR